MMMMLGKKPGKKESGGSTKEGTWHKQHFPSSGSHTPAPQLTGILDKYVNFQTYSKHIGSKSFRVGQKHLNF